MKVEKNQIIYMGEQNRRQRSEESEALQKKEQGKKTFFAGNLNGTQDRILQKKQEAQKKALKVVADAWNGDRELDEDIAARREKIHSLIQERKAAVKEIEGLEAEKEVLRESYGVAADSKEQKDVELLVKSRRVGRGEIQYSFTEEEQERLKELDGQTLTEYQTRVLSLDKAGDSYRDAMERANEEIKTENAIIRGVRGERLKNAPMLKAQKQADDIKEAATKEIVGMLVEESKEHVDEEQAEREEKTEEAKAETEDMPIQEMLVLDKSKEDIQKEVQDILNKMKLVEEDIKGSMVDETV